MELGMSIEKCNCSTHCQKGVEPMGDCVARLPGETVTGYCDICDPTHTKFTWHNNGSCISCVRNAREAKKQANMARHAQIMASAPNPVQIEDADIDAPVEEPRLANELLITQERKMQSLRPGTLVGVSVNHGIEIIFRFHGVDLVITKDLKRIERMLQCS